MMDTILFDLDNTLLDFDLAERIAIKKTLLHLKLEPTEKTLRRYSELNLAQWKLLEQGKLTRSAVKTRRFRILFEELGIERSVSEAAQTYESLLGAGHYFMDGAEELLHALAGKYRLYLVTNGTARVQKSACKARACIRILRMCLFQKKLASTSQAGNTSSTALPESQTSASNRPQL